ncbi:MAG: hemolysin family protein [Desulfosarcinaceae bacterium]|nr:hemolysin family protein [Desulfosarcinaceae bacterium]
MLADTVALVLLLALSGFFSSAETALFSISKTKARHLVKEGGRTDRLIWLMKEDPHRLLTTILIGNNVVNVAASALATAVTLNTFPNYAVGLATGVMTFLILVFGEVFPKSVATRNNIAIARFVIGPIYLLAWLFTPIILVLNFIPKLTGRIQETPSITEEELMTFVEVVEEEGEIKEAEKELIENIFEFDDTKASEIMTPRGDMFVVDVNEPLDLKAVAESGFTRIPVVDGDVDHVVGILNIKDLFMHQATSGDPVKLAAIMHKPYFVPEIKKLDQLLQQFKKRSHHIAIVVDEHGGVSGLITLEDALEEIVGEIRDETDREEPFIVRLKPREWRVLGKTAVDEVNDALGMEIPESSEYDTFSGYVLDQIGRIPQEKETLKIGDCTVVVQEMDGNRINKYLVRMPAQGGP